MHRRNTSLSTSLQGAVPPIMATGLLQHEAKLTVLNFGVKKVAGYAQPLPSKAELLLVTGVRCTYTKKQHAM